MYTVLYRYFVVFVEKGNDARSLFVRYQDTVDGDARYYWITKITTPVY